MRPNNMHTIYVSIICTVMIACTKREVFRTIAPDRTDRGGYSGITLDPFYATSMLHTASQHINKKCDNERLMQIY